VQLYNAPCLVVAKLEEKQQCSRTPVGEHAEVQTQDAECGCHEEQEVNEKRPNPLNSLLHNHDSTAPRQYSLIYAGAGPIHPVHGPLRSPAMEVIAPKGYTFSPFWRAWKNQKKIPFAVGGSVVGVVWLL